MTENEHDYMDYERRSRQRWAGFKIWKVLCINEKMKKRKVKKGDENDGQRIDKENDIPDAVSDNMGWLAYHFCIFLGWTEWWQIWLVIGMPFGIYRMCIWLLPKNFDIGGTVGVWAMNIMLGCLIGEVIIVGYVFRAIYVLIKYFVHVLR